MGRSIGSKNKPKTVEQLEKQTKAENTRVEKRTLYECSHPKVKGDRIYCAKGYRLGSNKDGTIPVTQWARGDPLELKICQSCPSFESMGDPVPADEKGWVGKGLQ